MAAVAPIQLPFRQWLFPFLLIVRSLSRNGIPQKQLDGVRQAEPAMSPSTAGNPSVPNTAGSPAYTARCELCNISVQKTARLGPSVVCGAAFKAGAGNNVVVAALLFSVYFHASLQSTKGYILNLLTFDTVSITTRCCPGRFSFKSESVW
jgi:hypothetical protein